MPSPVAAENWEYEGVIWKVRRLETGLVHLSLIQRVTEAWTQPEVFKAGFVFLSLLAAAGGHSQGQRTFLQAIAEAPSMKSCLWMWMMEVVETNGSFSFSTTGVVRPSSRCFSSCWIALLPAHGFAKAAQKNSLSAGRSGCIRWWWKWLFGRSLGKC